jgi:5-formyltetrahydrofolate cyclo-ligase
MEKQELRERVWDELEESGEARFPFPPHGRISNFAGADEAAARLASWLDDPPATLKANPDAPQLPYRRRALHDGAVCYFAQPRLRDERPFLRLDPAAIPPDEFDRAPTVSHVDDYATPVGPDDVPRLDLIVCGSVAVDERGGRVGKGEGFSDLEFAVLAELGAVDADTLVATTVHERQVLESVPHEPHDVPVDLAVTPERVVETETAYDRPPGVDWSLVDEAQVAETPVLRALRPE